jgi:thiamine-phosphate pyrophosphorylase
MRRIAGLYAIADTACIAANRFQQAVELAIAGGAAVVQYRDKSTDRERREQHARMLVELASRHEVPVVINDDPQLAARVRAAGVHLGRDDPPLAQARRLLGAHALIGVSCYNELERALVAEAQGADYVAFGRFFPSSTKPAAVLATPELLRAAKRCLHVPLVAIGGITPDNGAALISAGADALAVIGGLFAAADIRAAARRYAVLFAPPPPD